jgi:hypothetical protein
MTVTSVHGGSDACTAHLRVLLCYSHNIDKQNEYLPDSFEVFHRRDGQLQRPFHGYLTRLPLQLLPL